MFTARSNRSNLRKLGHSAGGWEWTASRRPREESTPIVHGEDADTELYGNETRMLGGTEAAFQTPWHRDNRRWVRWPAQLWHVTGQRFVPQACLSQVVHPSWLPVLGKAMSRGRLLLPYSANMPCNQLHTVW